MARTPLPPADCVHDWLIEPNPIRYQGDCPVFRGECRCCHQRATFDNHLKNPDAYRNKRQREASAAHYKGGWQPQPI